MDNLDREVSEIRLKLLRELAIDIWEQWSGAVADEIVSYINELADNDYEHVNN